MIAILIVSGGCYLLMLSLLVWAWRSASRKKYNTDLQVPFSIIIAARNEATNISTYLNSWLGQDYPHFELIIVLDRCQDDSLDRLNAIDDPRLRIIEVHHCPTDWSPKKWALKQGIAAAQNDWLAFTDADCELPSTWLRELSKHIAPHTEIILGLGPYRQRSGLLSRLQAFETAYTALQYIGFARLGMPYMGVGRNLAYQKSFFERVGGFGRFAERLSGDDDLLVNAYADPARTALMLSPSSWTWSTAEETWRDWFRQKTRHLSASPAYTVRSKWVLGLFHTTHLCVYILFIGKLIFDPTNLLVWQILFMRLGIGWLLWMAIKPRLDGLGSLLLYPVLDFLFFLYNLILVPIGTIRKPSWTKKHESQKTQKKTES